MMGRPEWLELGLCARQEQGPEWGRGGEGSCLHCCLMARKHRLQLKQNQPGSPPPPPRPTEQRLHLQKLPLLPLCHITVRLPGQPRTTDDGWGEG